MFKFLKVFSENSPKLYKTMIPLKTLRMATLVLLKGSKCWFILYLPQSNLCLSGLDAPLSVYLLTTPPPGPGERPGCEGEVRGRAATGTPPTLPGSAAAATVASGPAAEPP